MEGQSSIDVRRKVLRNSIGHFILEAGWQFADKDVLETLTEMLQSVMMEFGRCTKAYAELAGRVDPIVADLVLAYADLGIKLDPVGMRSFSRRHGRPIIPNPQALPPPKIPSILSAGKRRPLPNYIPDYFPQMPDPHTYIRTPTHKQPLTDYAACREKTSQNKRDLERSLSKFYARTSPCYYLFPENTSLFPLISPKPTTYLEPLIPRDQIFEEETNIAPLNFIKKEKPVDNLPKLNDDDDGPTDQTTSNLNTSWELIDNPFLRPVTVRPKKLKKHHQSNPTI